MDEHPLNSEIIKLLANYGDSTGKFSNHEHAADKMADVCVVHQIIG